MKSSRIFVSYLFVLLAALKLHGQANIVNLAADGLLGSLLSQHGGIYVGKITKTDLLIETNRTIERGTITLSVAKTIYGDKRETIILPYNYAKYAHSIWPEIDVIGSNQICVITDTALRDQANAPLASPLGANVDMARKVIIISENDRNIVSDVERMCEMYRSSLLKNSHDMFADLKIAASDISMNIRLFSADLAIFELGKKESDMAIKYLQYEALHFGDKFGAYEAQYIITSIFDKNVIEKGENNMNKYFSRCLLVILQSNTLDIEVRGQAMKVFAHLVSAQPPFSFLAKDTLTDGESNALNAILTTKSSIDEKKLSNEFAIVGKWLAN